MKYHVIIPAAGQGKRMGAGKNKLLLELDNEPIILHTLNIFLQDADCEKVAVITQKEEADVFSGFINKLKNNAKVFFVNGGQERQHSVYNGMKALGNEECSVVLVHDGARPFIKKEVIRQLVKTAEETGAAIAAVPVKDTIKKADCLQVKETVERSNLWQVQTPQAFQYNVLWKAHKRAIEEDFLGTDESSLVERLEYPVQIVESDYDNIKLTTPEDLYFAEAIIKKRAFS
ncbi:2-C-methyl-D-erythritol 4-phosphate cytidylyltransferase [Heyndrickxia acidicola]|uniref:2-C-methyl-D-erythritol 4-phosphate cytidylyltransferase n=1 Tax=Heyndrickxia acidicola TaxID=209389 RepID=A0ABU6MNX4_9BACI|nr:2-C-methyl-D-erythritol 4-phosphate cytidylyltransferase [Heyndrickxia acidicola]MED1205686.1 2-C-methyl-D-erythritol 4-phosphate cytidylyltransferase [Heyndrickxia acidicola]